MNKQTLLVVGALLASLVALGVASSRPNPTVEVVREVVKEIREVGAVTGPDITSPFISVNGIQTFYSKQEMRQSTSTPCALQSPKSATSTLTSFTAQFRVSSTSLLQVDIGKDDTAFATTTLLNAKLDLKAGKGATLRASTT